MHPYTRSLVAAAAAATLVTVPAVASADRSDRGASPAAATTGDLDAVGLVRNGRALVSFSTGSPGQLQPIGRVSGLSGDTMLVGIDYRVQNGELYGVGNQGGIYVVSAEDASASKVSQLTVPLQGSRFGVDFNPAANALRVISDTGQNLRHSFAVTPPGPTTADGTLTYPPLTTPATGVTGAAYTNNDLDPNTATTLYDIDTNLDQGAIQAPANEGNLSPTGLLGVDSGVNAGFDIYSTLRGGSTVDVTGYATLSVGGQFRLYEITLFTGKATAQGTFPRSVTDVAIPLNQV